MIGILESYKQYVPSQEVVLESPPPDLQDVTDESHVPFLLGGDYLTAARARGAQLIRCNSELQKDCLNEFHPCAEDWHCKVALLQVCTITYIISIVHQGIGMSMACSSWGTFRNSSCMFLFH